MHEPALPQSEGRRAAAQEASVNRLVDFPISRKWPAQNPERLQLYSLPTPNGVKVSIALEETSLPYEAHRVEFSTNDQFSLEFLSLNPNNKIPAIIDPNGPADKPLALFESGAILLYLADKTGQLMPSNTADRYRTMQWLMWQMSAVGPMFGQLGYFHKFAGREIEEKRPRDRYVTETRRLLTVLDLRLSERSWIMGEQYTLADIAIFPWVHNLFGFYDAGALVGAADFSHVNRALTEFCCRPAVKRGMAVPGNSDCTRQANSAKDNCGASQSGSHD